MSVRGRGQERPGPITVTRVIPGRTLATAGSGADTCAMEFLNFLIIGWAAWLLWRRPERERLAFLLLVVACLLMALGFFIGSHGSLVPGVNL